jgi:hypothetical protein
MDIGKLDEKTFESSLQELDKLAIEEYRASLGDLVKEDNDERRILRLGRLVGVTLKVSFATPVTLDYPSGITGAYRKWELNPEAFRNPQVKELDEYKALEMLRTDKGVTEGLGYEPIDAYDVATVAQSERGFFWYLASSSRGYLCGNTKLRNKINGEIQNAKRSGINLKNINPNLIVASCGLAIGNALVQNVPVLSVVGVPTMAALVLVIYSVGIDAFCQWTSEHRYFHVNFPNADQDAA